MRSRRLLTYALPVGLVLTVFAVMPSLADEAVREGDGPSVDGVVSDVSGTAIKLFDGLLTVDASGATVIPENDNRPLTLADVNAGLVIQVQGNMVGQALHATLIQVHGPKAGGTLQGAIETVDPSTGHFPLLGLTVAVTSAAVFESDNGVPLTFADLGVGKVSTVEVVVFQGRLVATRISLGKAGRQSDGNH
jgi:hypothetical protein